MNRSSSKRDIGITLGVLSAVALVYAMVKSNAWRRRAGLIYIDIAVSMIMSFGWHQKHALLSAHHPPVLTLSVWATGIGPCKTCVPNSGPPSCLVLPSYDR